MKRAAGGRAPSKAPAKNKATAGLRAASVKLRAVLVKPSAAVVAAPGKLVSDVRRLIASARTSAAATVNTELTQLHRRIGERIRTEVPRRARAAYGEQVIVALAATLTGEHGRGFSERSRRRMVQLAELFPAEPIVASLSRQLTWSHFMLLLPLEAPLARAFHAEMCRVERWSVRALRQQIDGMLHERTALSRKPGEEAPLGILLCAGAGRQSEQSELLELGKTGTHVAEHLTVLPSRRVLTRKLHAALEHGRAGLASREET